MSNFSEKIKQLRLLNNESQKDLASILNVSFQSVSKWENDINFPDIITLQLLADHYNISIDELISERKTTTNVAEYNVAINKQAPICVWTDFMVNDTIAPVAYLDPTRHRCGAELPHHPGPKDTIIIGVNDQNKICFLGDHFNFRYPTCSPDGFIYESDSTGHPCHILKPTYSQANSFDFEFVIPKDGFVVVLDKRHIATYQILENILPKKYHSQLNKRSFFVDMKGAHLFRHIILHGELDSCKITLGNTLTIISSYDEGNDNKSESSNIEKRIAGLENRIDQLEQLVSTLEDEIDDLQSKIDDLE